MVADIKKCEEFQNRCLRRILKVFSPNKISSNFMRERIPSQLRITSNPEVALHRPLKRKELDDDTNIALTWEPEGTRKRERPKETKRRTTA